MARDRCPGVAPSVEAGQPALPPQALHLAENPCLSLAHVGGRLVDPQLLRVGQDRGQQRGLGEDPLGGLGAFGRWNVGNWVADTQQMRHAIGL